MTYAAMILGMAVLTVAIRTLVMLLGHRLSFPPLARQALDFVPVSVLTAIILPAVTAPRGEMELTWRNPQLVGAIVAVAVCLLTRHQLLTIALAMLAFAGWRFGVL